jgi:replication initiation and membrane attachment protein DnaB
MDSCNDVIFLKFMRDSNFPSNEANHDVITAITELQGHKKLTDSEISKIEETIIDTKNHLKELEKSVADIREMARDAKHISIGVDGRNGLRGTLDHLAKDVSKLAEDVDFVKKAADNYVSNKEFLTRLLTASFMGIVGQVAFAIWYVSAQHSQQEALKADVTRLLARIDRQSEAPLNGKASLK